MDTQAILNSAISASWLVLALGAVAAQRIPASRIRVLAAIGAALLLLVPLLVGGRMAIVALARADLPSPAAIPLALFGLSALILTCIRAIDASALAVDSERTPVWPAVALASVPPVTALLLGWAAVASVMA